MSTFADTPLSEGVRQSYAQAQAKADKVAQAFNDSAPRWLDGETLISYRRRLLTQFKSHSPAWRAVETLPRDEPTLRIAEDQVYADAFHAARNPIVPPGQLVERIETDQSGRRISRFHGDVEAFLGPFKYPAQQVIAIGGRR